MADCFYNMTKYTNIWLISTWNSTLLRKRSVNFVLYYITYTNDYIALETSVDMLYILFHKFKQVEQR